MCVYAYTHTHTHTHTHTYIYIKLNHSGVREFCQENALVIANTLFQKHKRRLYT